jgi:hypothetical protein
VVVLLLACATGPAEQADKGDPADTAEPAADTGDTASSPDADGDGYTVAAGDCDDRLPHVYPGAPDHCDGLDADCDGEPIPAGSCGAGWQPREMWRWSIESTAYNDPTVFCGELGDVDGDGRGELVALGAGTEVGPFFGAWLDTLPARGPMPALAWDREQMGVLPAGDIDGDGYADHWSGTLSSPGLYRGALYLHRGSPAGFPYTGERDDRHADASWLQTSAALYFGELDASGDLNGDGLADAVVYFYDDAHTTWLGVLAPGPEAAGEHAFDALPRVRVDDSFVLYTTMRTQTDLDGDGIDEWLGVEQDEPWNQMITVEGEELQDGAVLSDLVHRSWYEAEEETSPLLYAEGRAEDLDGDGTADLVLTVLEQPETYRLLVVPGIPEGNLAGLAFAEVVGSTPSYLTALGWVDDMDGDSVREVSTGVAIILSTDLRAGGVLEAAGRQWLRQAEDHVLMTSATDLTGDGLPEFVFREDYWHADEDPDHHYGRSLIVEGFAVPWDDPTKW